MLAYNLSFQATDPKRDVHVGFTFQWEMLDCFLSPHTCTTNQTVSNSFSFYASDGFTRLLESQTF